MKGGNRARYEIRRWQYLATQVARIQGQAENIQQIPKDAGVFVSRYNPLTNEALVVTIENDTDLDILQEQARRANALAAECRELIATFTGAILNQGQQFALDMIVAKVAAYYGEK